MLRIFNHHDYFLGLSMKENAFSIGEDNIRNVKHAYNTIADKYDSELSDYELCFFPQFFDTFEGKYAIDLGCGQGRIAEYCHVEKGLDIFGCDISERMLEIAANKNKFPDNISFILSDMQKVESPRQYDVAIASFSFMHLTYSQARKTLINLSNLLKRDGMLFISLLLGDKCGYVNDPLDSNVKIFVKQYTEIEITQLLTSSGYSVTAINYGEDNDVAALSKDAIYIFAKKRGKRYEFS
jgi:cyclopropane fatty-acyl-phospholipid synthase-like methyltransferase